MTDRQSPCPVCGRPATPACRPFCSKRCADVDLGRWLNEVYTVPGDEPQPAAGTGLIAEDDEE